MSGTPSFWRVPSRWPLAVKVPALVAALLIAVSVVLTNAVMSRLRDTQERHLAALTATYLNGLSSALIPHVLRDDVWEVFDAIERSATLEGGFGRSRVRVLNASGELLAASDPKRDPIASRPAVELGVTADKVTLDATAGRAHVRRDLVHQGRPIGTILADFDVSSLLAERRDVLRTLIATNAAIAVLVAVAGFLAARRLMRPLDVLSRHMASGASGPMAPIADGALGPADTEFGRLGARFNAMARAVEEREALIARLDAEERMKSLGRLASGVAHEINNPLGGLFAALDTLKAHGDKPLARVRSTELLDRGLRSIRDTVRATLAIYRSDRDRRALEPADLDDLRRLVGSQLQARGLRLDWSSGLRAAVPVPAAPVRQVVLNLLLNAIEATPVGGAVSAAIFTRDNALVVTVSDEGPGLPAAARTMLESLAPRPLPSTGGHGLGLWMTRRLVAELGGRLSFETGPTGTSVVVVMPFEAEQRDASEPDALSRGAFKGLADVA